MTFVIDCSVVSGWILASQSDAYTDAIANRLITERAAAPMLLPLEYSNLLRSACLRGKLVASEAQVAIAALARLPIAIDSEPPAPAALLALALRFGLTTYDAMYLDLALRRQVPLATRDADLIAAAQASGVGLVPALG